MFIGETLWNRHWTSEYLKPHKVGLVGCLCGYLYQMNNLKLEHVLRHKSLENDDEGVYAVYSSSSIVIPKSSKK